MHNEGESRRKKDSRSSLFLVYSSLRLINGFELTLYECENREKEKLMLFYKRDVEYEKGYFPS